MIIYQSKSMTGSRDKNEDELDTIVNNDGADTAIIPVNYFGVYDGHGGPAVSGYLKKHLHKSFLSIDNKFVPKAGSKCNKQIGKIFDRMQQKIKDEVSSSNCGSTTLIAINYGKSSVFDQLKIINLGDCRAVLCSENDIAIPLTKDHKPMSWNENKRIKKLGGTIVHDLDDDPRISGLSVSRAFGDTNANPYVTHCPEIYDYELKVKHGKILDKFLILACDGVWDVLSNQDVVDFILYKTGELTKLVTCDLKGNNNVAQMLAKHAIEKGSTDNISVVIIFFKN